MSLFKSKSTELKIIVKESFNSEHKEAYNFELETEGGYIQIKLPIIEEIVLEGATNGDNIESRRKLPNKQ
jgi:hypothetical protein